MCWKSVNSNGQFFTSYCELLHSDHKIPLEFIGGDTIHGLWLYSVGVINDFGVFLRPQ